MNQIARTSSGKYLIVWRLEIRVRGHCLRLDYFMFLSMGSLQIIPIFLLSLLKSSYETWRCTPLVEGYKHMVLGLFWTVSIGVHYVLG